jgi:hypothetical protein
MDTTGLHGFDQVGDVRAAVSGSAWGRSAVKFMRQLYLGDLASDCDIGLHDSIVPCAWPNRELRPLRSLPQGLCLSAAALRGL